MKKKTALLKATLSFCLVILLTSCSFLAKALREGADKIEQQSAKNDELSVDDQVASLVANISAQTLAAQTEAPAEVPTNTAPPTEAAVDTPVPSPTIESITPPTVTPLPSQMPIPQAPSKPDKEVRLMGLSFTLPGDLDYTVTIEEVEEWPDPNTLGHGNIGPGHILFHLNPSSDHQHTHDGPRIYVFPGHSFWKYYEDETKLVALNLLRDLENFSDYDVDEALPFPPLFNAMQMYHSNEKVILFQNGSGIRFLTAYHQIYAPIVTQDLFYAFMGLTDDQNYFVVAIIPIYNSPLPWTTPLPPDGDPFYANYKQHLLNTANILNDTSPANFDPNLDLLDKLFKSLRLSVQ